MQKNKRQQLLKEVTESVQEVIQNDELLCCLKEYEIYDWYYSQRLYESESINSNDWAEVKDLLGQMGRVTAKLILKLSQMGKKAAVNLCVTAAKNLYKKYHDVGEATKYLFWALMMFVIGYGGNALKDKYNFHPIVPGTFITFEEEKGVDTLTVTNQRGGVFTVSQPDVEKAPVITLVKKSQPKKAAASSPEQKQMQKDAAIRNSKSPIRLLTPGEEKSNFYTASPEMIKALCNVEKFVDHIYDAKVGTEQIRKGDMGVKSKDLTIGYGHKLTLEERKNWSWNKRITKEEAFELFKKDLRSTEKQLNSCLRKLPYDKKVEYSQGLIDGLTSVLFNCGYGNMFGAGSREQSELWRRLGNCRIDKVNNCIDRSDIDFTLAQTNRQNITERGHYARRRAEYFIMMQPFGQVKPELYNLKNPEYLPPVVNKG